MIWALSLLNVTVVGIYCGLNCIPTKRYTQVLTSVPVHVTFFGYRVFADIINQVKMKSHRIDLGPNPRWLVPLWAEGIDHRNRSTGRTSCGNGGRDWSDVPIKQGTPRLSATQKLRERDGTGFSLVFREQEPSSAPNTLISLWASRKVKWINIYYLKPPS